ncbi:hypothetical protein PISMIDRAFT_677468 [Pisolithus microcarpus 441]|uniref:Uncharacterized protein n=1 Tax=Pisolithus microcarpus 441 TaxID=765257 RepID=A0A0C9ZZJ3_9AGAM|nr:hypothetical protein PISMIDRAFT_677468 [Pisolithus microcarpus 441]
MPALLLEPGGAFGFLWRHVQLFDYITPAESAVLWSAWNNRVRTIQRMITVYVGTAISGGGRKVRCT